MEIVFVRAHDPAPDASPLRMVPFHDFILYRG